MSTELKSPADCFETLREKIAAVPGSAHAVMNMPYEEAMQEGRRVAALVTKYREQLAASDIDPVLLDEIGDRSGAFAYCVAALEANVEVNESHNEQFTLLRKEGYALRRKLLADFDYIFRNDSEVRTALANIREGRGDLDMFKDLLSLHKLSQDYRERLEKAHFNFEDTQKAFQFYNELFNLSAQRDIDPEKMSEAKLMVVRSWTLLKEALDEIYAAGRYVFYENPEVEELFYSDYRQKIGAMPGKSHTEPSETGEEEKNAESVTASTTAE